MPFFTVQTHRLMKPQPMPLDQVEALCRQRSLDDLQNLKQRMRAFFNEQSANRKKATAKILEIDVQINSIESNILAKQKQIELAEASNREIWSNLPGNGAERFLALQQLHPVPSNGSLKEQDEIKKLRTIQTNLKNDIAWINYEFITCDPEWKIVNKIIAEKTLQIALSSIPDKRMEAFHQLR